MLTGFLNKILAQKDLTETETGELLSLITGTEAMHSQIGGVLTALRMKGESASELLGGARFLRRYAAFIDCAGLDPVDVVGTGGDDSGSFNISTASAIVAAAAGVIVAKHGNRAVSGKCGAADVLAELGFNLDAAPEAMERSIRDNGIGFLFAPKMHPIMGKVGVLRRELKIRTIFNMLGPLCNPAGARRIVLGVYSPLLVELYAEVLRGLGCRRAMVVCGAGGLDEISCAKSTRVAELRDGRILCYELHPEIVLGESFPESDLRGGDPKCNAEILCSVLEKRSRPGARAAVLLNAGAAIYVADRAKNLADGARIAAEAIDSGAAQKKLAQLIGASRA